MKKLVQFFQWPTVTLSNALRRIPAMQRFDTWANAKERQWRQRRNGRLNAPLVEALRSAGMDEQADKLASL